MFINIYHVQYFKSTKPISTYFSAWCEECDYCLVVIYTIYYTKYFINYGV